MDLFSRSSFGNFLFSIHILIRRFGVLRILLVLLGVVIVMSGLVGSTILVQQSQETRKYASAGWCKVEDNGVTAGFVPCDTPGETLQGTYDQVMNIRDNAPAIDPGLPAEQLQAVQQQVGNANIVVNDEGKREITGGTHGGQEIITDCSGNSCNTGNEGNGATVGNTTSETTTHTSVVTGTNGGSTQTGNGTTADNACTAQPDCGGPNQGYCTCGADGKPDPKGIPTCQGGYMVLGGDCVPIGTTERTGTAPAPEGTHCQSDSDCGSGLMCSGKVCSEKPKATSTPVATERYGITDNICHLPGANCVGDEAWRNGSAAARGDLKALEKLKALNPTVFSQVTVDGGVVKTTQQAALPEQQKDQTISPEIAKKLESFKSQCSERLGLCPMIDPRDGTTVVGWVPSKIPLFGTYEDAKLARLNISIGDLSGANTPEYGSTVIRSATKEDFEKALAGQLTEENIKKWKAQAEKDQLKVGADGQAIKDKDGNILTVSGSLSKAENDRREALFVQQETARALAQDKVVENIVKNENENHIAWKAILQCVQKGKFEDCSPEEIQSKLNLQTEKLSTDRLNKILNVIKTQYIDIKKKSEDAMAFLLGDNDGYMQACMQFNNGKKCDDEASFKFTQSYQEFLPKRERDELDGILKTIYSQLLDQKKVKDLCEKNKGNVCSYDEQLEYKNELALRIPPVQKNNIDAYWLKLLELKPIKIDRREKDDYADNDFLNEYKRALNASNDPKIPFNPNDYKNLSKEQLDVFNNNWIANNLEYQRLQRVIQQSQTPTTSNSQLPISPPLTKQPSTTSPGCSMQCVPLSNQDFRYVELCDSGNNTVTQVSCSEHALAYNAFVKDNTLVGQLKADVNFIFGYGGSDVSAVTARAWAAIDLLTLGSFTNYGKTNLDENIKNTSWTNENRIKSATLLGTVAVAEVGGGALALTAATSAVPASTIVIPNLVTASAPISSVLSSPLGVMAKSIIGAVGIESGGIAMLAQRDALLASATSTVQDILNANTIERFVPQLNTVVVVQNGYMYDKKTGNFLGTTDQFSDYYYLNSTTVYGSQYNELASTPKSLTDLSEAKNSWVKFLPTQQHDVVTSDALLSLEYQQFKLAVDSATDADPTNLELFAVNAKNNLTYDPVVAEALSLKQAVKEGNDSTAIDNTKAFASELVSMNRYMFSNRNLDAMISNNNTICFDFAVAGQIYLASKGIHAELASSSQLGHAFLLVERGGTIFVVDPTWGITMSLEEHKKYLKYNDIAIVKSPLGKISDFTK